MYCFVSPSRIDGMSSTRAHTTNDSVAAFTSGKEGVNRVLLGRGHGIPGTVYGTIVVMAALVAGSADTADWDLVAVVASAALVIWIAHVYAHGLGESIARDRRLNLPDLRAIMSRQFPILAAALVPTLALSLGALDVMRESGAIWLALGVGLLTLCAEGVRYARVEQMGTLGTTLAITANLALGAIVVSMKVLFG